MINNVNIFTIYKSLNVIKYLPTIYQNKTKVPGIMSKFEFNYQER